MPKGAELATLLGRCRLQFLHSSDCIVHAKVLVVSGQELYKATRKILVSHEALDQVEETLLGTYRAQDRLQRNEPLLFL